MNAWQWAAAYPDAIDGVMPVVSMPMPISGRNMLWREGRFVVQPGSAESFGHSTMAHPERWSGHVAQFMRWLGGEAFQG